VHHQLRCSHRLRSPEDKADAQHNQQQAWQGKRLLLLRLRPRPMQPKLMAARLQTSWSAAACLVVAPTTAPPFLFVSSTTSSRERHRRGAAWAGLRGVACDLAELSLWARKQVFGCTAGRLRSPPEPPSWLRILTFAMRAILVLSRGAVRCRVDSGHPGAPAAPPLLPWLPCSGPRLAKPAN